MSESGRLCQTQWLHRVLDTLMQFRGAASDRALADLRDRLSSLVWADDAPTAAAFAAESEGDRFRRHPLATVEATGCSALLMYWPAGHATLPHDHDGLWGIEVVVDGRLDVEEFVRSETGSQTTLTHARSLRLEAGDAALFADRRYVHRCRNLSNIAPTLTLHVYGGALETYTSYEHDAAGRLVARRSVARSDRSLS